MNTNSPEWLAAEVLADPDDAFVLWLIHHGVCNTIFDCYRHYGLSFPFWRTTNSLISKGLIIRKNDGRLYLSSIGIDAMTQLGDHEQPSFTQITKRHSVFHNIFRLPDFSKLRFSLIAIRLLMSGFGLLAWSVLAPTRITHPGDFKLHDASGPLFFIAGYISTMIGVLIGSVYQTLRRFQFKGQRHVTSFANILRISFTSFDFWAGACSSPIIYALILQSIDGGSLISLLAIAIQTGFALTILMT